MSTGLVLPRAYCTVASICSSMSFLSLFQMTAATLRRSPAVCDSFSIMEAMMTTS